MKVAEGTKIVNKRSRAIFARCILPWILLRFHYLSFPPRTKTRTPKLQGTTRAGSGVVLWAEGEVNIRGTFFSAI